jgi:hypothetical protein
MAENHERRSRGRPQGCTQLSVENEQVLATANTWLFNRGTDLQRKLEYLRLETTENRVMRVYVLAGKRYVCPICNADHDPTTASAFRDHVKRPRHYNAEVLHVKGT